MARRPREIRNGEAFCDTHQLWHPTADFELVRRQMHDGTVVMIPKYRDCKLARQSTRDELRATDPAHMAILGRARSLAGNMTKAFGCTISTDFVWYEENYRSLVGPMRALTAPDGVCQGCGRDHDTLKPTKYGLPSEPRYWHLSHNDPPRSLTDLARHHAENIKIRCPGDNGSQHQTEQTDWVEINFRRWTVARQWSTKAGGKGWPPYDPSFGMIPEIDPPPQELRLDFGGT